MLTLLTIVIMLVFGGMAVDFMHFESRRAKLQSVADRSVLAAAELDQTLDPKDVVIDYYTKAGFADSIVGVPEVNDQAGSRTVAVASVLDLNTFYLRLIGIDQLNAPASAQAIEGTGNIEVSLVLDISGSMRHKVGGTRKIELLQDAANAFLTDLLKPEYAGQISVSLVSYSTQVNLGDDLFRAIATPEVIEDNTVLVTDDSLDPDHDLYNPNLSIVEPGNPLSAVAFANPARCVRIPQSEYTNTAFNPGIVYQQVESFQSRRYRHGHPEDSSGVRFHDQPTCPNADYEAIIPVSQNLTALKAAVSQLDARQFTSIYLGMKWGVALLDPSMRSIVGSLPDTDAAFAGKRPTNYAAAGDSLNTKKYVVLMTDGQNVSAVQLKDTAYDTVAERLQWDLYNYPYYDRYTSNTPSLGSLTNQNFSASDADALLQDICGAAKTQGITVFAIAMGAGSHGEGEMEDCASDGHFYKTDGANGALTTIFKQIAEQITALRLSL